VNNSVTKYRQSMKKITATIFFLIVVQHACYTQDTSRIAQEHQDVLHSLDTATHDTTRVLLIAELADYYKGDLPDSALFYGYKALALARQIKFPRGEVRALDIMVLALLSLGNDSKALQMALQGLKIAEKNKELESQEALRNQTELENPAHENKPYKYGRRQHKSSNVDLPP